MSASCFCVSCEEGKYWLPFVMSFQRCLYSSQPWTQGLCLLLEQRTGFLTVLCVGRIVAPSKMSMSSSQEPLHMLLCRANGD